MTDILSGDTAYRSDSPPPAPEPTVTMPLPSDTRASDAAFSVEQLGDMAESAAENRISEREWLDNAASELKQKRERDGDGLDGTPPIVEVRASRQGEAYKLREAQKEYSEGHRLYSATAALQKAREAINSTRPVSDEDIRQHADNVHELGIQAGTPEKPGEAPWNPMGLIEDGKFVKPLRDDQKVTLDEALTPRQAAKQIGNWREWQAAAQEQLVTALQGEEAKRQVVEAAQQIQQAQPRPAPVQQQPRQPQVDPVAAAQRQHLAAQQAALNLSAEQKAIVERCGEWQRWASKIPELQSWEALRYTQQHDPARHAQVMKALQAGKTFNDAAARRFGELNEIRHSRAQRWAQAQGARNAEYQKAAVAQRQQLNRQADDQFNSWLSKEYPQFSSERAFKELRTAAREAVREATGWNDAQVDQAWNHGILRSPAAQQMVAHSAVARLQKQSREGLKAHRARVPQPMAPSAGGLRSNDADTEIRSLQQRLEGQTGRNALMTAVQLQNARRKAGRA